MKTQIEKVVGEKNETAQPCNGKSRGMLNLTLNEMANEAAVDQMEWIPITDIEKLPKEEVRVLVLNTSGNIQVGTYSPRTRRKTIKDRIRFFGEQGRYKDVLWDVKYWMPFPAFSHKIQQEFEEIKQERQEEQEARKREWEAKAV